MYYSFFVSAMLSLHLILMFVDNLNMDVPNILLDRALAEKRKNDARVFNCAAPRVRSFVPSNRPARTR